MLRRDVQARALAVFLFEQGGSVARVVRFTGISCNFAEKLVTQVRGRRRSDRSRGALWLTTSPERMLSATLFWACLRRQPAADAQTGPLETFFTAYRLFVALRAGIGDSDPRAFNVDDALEMTLIAETSPISLRCCPACGGSFWSVWKTVRSRCPICKRQNRFFAPQQQVDASGSLPLMSAAE